MLLAAVVAATGCTGADQAREARDAETLALGADVYHDHCVGCHGVAGDGRGPAAARLLTKPRDFRQGTYKFRSTPPGSPPTDDDLLRVVTRGVPYTSMQPYDGVPLRERRAVVQYVKAFSLRWRGIPAPPPWPAPPAPPDAGTAAAIEKGRAAYERGMCKHCHGVRGDATGVMAHALIDDWGHHTRPADFTLGMFKSGPARVDAVRTIMTGLGGTAMASFADVLDDGEAWYLADYLHSLARPAQTREHLAALLLARDYPDAFSTHVGDATPEAALALALRGSDIDAEKQCMKCHSVGSMPARRSNDWHVAHFTDPRSVVPLSRMPAFPSFFDEAGRPNADGLAVIAYIQATALPEPTNVRAAASAD